MKITTTKKEIIDSLLIAQYFIASGSTLPLLSNILFEASDDSLNLFATDMDISVKIKCKISKVEEEGKTTIPKKIISLIKEFPEDEIKIISDEKDNIKLQCKKSSYKIPGMPAEDFPLFHLDDKKLETIKMSRKLLKDIIKKIAYAALKDSTKRNLNGVFFKFEDKTLEAVSTDAHRLAFYKAELAEAVKTKFEYIIPLKTINEVAKILDGDDEKEIEINFYEKVIEFKFDNIDIVSRVIDENYPNYNQVIPSEFAMTAKVDKKELASAVRRVSTITSDKSKIILLKFDQNKLFINAQTQDEGEAFEEIDISYDGDAVDVSYNAMYLTDVLKVIEGDNIEIKLLDSMKPGVVKESEKDNFLYVIMPIRK